jgi:DNA adenine methylase
MKYIGGKYRYQQQITEVINHYIEDGQPYYEPFIGGAWIAQNIQNRPVYASDHDIDLILLYQEAQRKTDFIPDELSEELYNDLKHRNLNLGEHSPLIGFAKFACSFGGKAWGGYSRYRNRVASASAEGKRSIQRQMTKMKHVNFAHKDYRELSDVGDSFMYCDPPYYDCTPAYCKGFDHIEFWEWVRDMSRTNTVLVSEYVAPEDFECVLEINTNLNIHPAKNDRNQRMERIFKYRGN